MDELDDAIALVYAQPPSGFVAARAALVKELKAAKHGEAAAAVAALRRPTKMAWALGDAVRRDPQRAAAFFAAVAALAEPGDDLRLRTADLRRAVAAVVADVEGVDPGDATGALLATAADPEATDALRRRRLADVPAAGGFGGLPLGGKAVVEPAPAPEAEEAAAAVGDEHPAGDGSASATDAAADAARRRRDEAAQERARLIAALEAERERAADAELAATAPVEAAQAAVEAASTQLRRATEARDEAAAAHAGVAERLRQAEELPPDEN